MDNKVILEGVVDNTPVISHKVKDEDFYTFKLKVKRLSDVYDIIPIYISANLIGDIDFGSNVKIYGQYRSYNNYNGNPKLVLGVLVKTVEVVEKCEDINEVNLTGFICKKPN
jgi:hypothetical protein